MDVMYYIYEDKNKPYKNELYVNYKWRFPSYRCRKCFMTWYFDYQYPLVDLSELPNESNYRKYNSLFPENYNKSYEEIRPYVPSHLLIEPGTQFGSLEGKAIGIFGDFAWHLSTLMLVRRSVASRLIDCGLKMPDYAETNIQYRRRKDIPDFVQYQLEPSAQLNLIPEKKSCDVCQYYRPRMGIDYSILRNTIRTDCDIFYLDAPSLGIVVTQRFKDIVEDLNLTDISFREVKVI